MKSMMLILLLSIGVCLAFASTGEYVPTQYKQAFTITAKSADHMDIRFTLPEYNVEEIQQGDQVFHRVIIPDTGSTLTSGLPQLPTISMTLAIPRQGGIQIQALSSRQNQLTQFHAYPVQEGDDLESPKSFVIDSDFYASGSAYPAAAIEYSDPMILRDFRIVNVQINPFSYDPVSQALTVRESVDFRVSFTNEPGINELEGELVTVSPAFANLYESFILNFDDYRSALYAHTPPRYLIIYGNNTDPNFVNALNDYVLWKRQKGANVDLANTSSGSAGSSTTTIKAYIQTAYNNPDTRPDFVVLIGDTSGSYTIPTYTVSSGVGDYPYTHLAGSDGLGDVFIGRISAENLSQLQTLFAKIYLYERDLNLDTAQWLDRMLLIGDSAHSGVSTYYVNKYIKERALFINPDYTFTELLQSGPSVSAMNTALNQGVGFMNYRGYIGMSGWSPSESSLTNGFRLPHAVIITCSTGNFGSTGTTESFIRLGTAAAPKGAVTAIGMATSSTHTTFNNCLNCGIFSGILGNNMRTMGEGLLHGKIYLYQLFGVSSPSNATNFAHWCNLMGDPTMEVFTGIPDHFSITVQDSIPLGLSLLDIAVRNGDDVSVEGACVTITQNGSIISRGYTDSDGNVIMVLPQAMTAANCTITVSKHDFKPLQQAIGVSSTGTLVPGSVVVDDDNTGSSAGNNDGIINAGETLEMLFGLTNTGTATISGITGHVATNSPYVTFSDSLVTYVPIAGNSLGFNSLPVVMHIDPAAPHEAMIRMHLLLTDDMGGTYNVSEFLQIHNSKMMFNSCLVTNGGNQVLDPGETAGFTVTVSNITPTTVSNIYGRLYSLNDLVSVTDNIAYYGDLLQNVQVTPSADMFELYGRPMLLPGMIIPMQLKLYNDAGFAQWLDFTLTIGVVDVHDPLGPDAYGYVIYDDQDTEYAECPVYDWVGIAPAEGGVGTPLAITDSYSSGDEGDQVGSDPLEVVTLPFPFQFYGQTYNQITVCSNGFIAMGVSANPEFRNGRLPGAMGPGPMIAPFWDDLATVAGSGIYTWFDRNNHAFVIEWYNLKNGHNGTSTETFQVILYDPSVHATSLGDGPIKFQYNTFNNVNSQSGAEHGNFASIGIEDATESIGLEYSFNNQYPTAASQLGNQRALYITNVPIYHEEAHVILGETYIDDANGNGVCEPGETVSLGVQLQNIGNMVANNIVATLTTEDTNITMVSDSTSYYPLAGDAYGVNINPFIFTVSPTCPNGTVVNFVLTIVAGEDTWTRNFSLRVDASVMMYNSFMVNDADANYNGIIDPLETVKIIINMNNHADVQARDVQATLSTASPDVIISEPIITHNTIEANAVMQFVYELQFIGTASVGNYVPFQFNVSMSNGLPVNTNLMIPYNMANIFNDFETNNGNFVSEMGWEWGVPSQVTPYSGQKLWATGLSGNYPNLVNYTLVTPLFSLESGSVLTFRHRYGFETGYDGGNISISTNNGDTWTLLTPPSGYPYSNLGGLDGEPGYSGSIANWEQVSISLNQYVGQQVMFRFRMGSDGAYTNIGWFIDNFELSHVNQKSGYLHGTVIPTSNTPVTDVLVMANNYYATHPQSDGTYRLYLPNGTFSATASLPYHQSSTANNIVVTPDDPIHVADFTLINLPKPEGISFDVDNDSGLVSLAWNPPYDPVLPVMTYHVFKKFNAGPFEMIQETTSPTFSETISLHGLYEYYVKAVFLNTEGCPSDTVSFSFPYVGEGEETAPGLVTRLNGNYPNPFNPTTTLSFDLAQGGNVKLSIYNIKGQLVKVLQNGVLEPGMHRLVWDGRDSANRTVASGVYFYRFETKGYCSTRKMLMLK